MGVRRLPDPRMPRPRTTPPVEVNGSAKQPLGMPAADVPLDYWQNKPQLTRNPIPGFASPIEPADPADLACEDAAPSRLFRPVPAHHARTRRHRQSSGGETPD